MDLSCCSMKHIFPRIFICLFIWSISFLTDLFNCWKPWLQWQRMREICLSIYSPNGYNAEHWIRPKSEIWIFLWMSYMRAGAQRVGTSSSIFPGTLAGNQQRSETAVYHIGSYRGHWFLVPLTVTPQWHQIFLRKLVQLATLAW